LCAAGQTVAQPDPENRQFIALILALPEGEREPGLEYHLVLCLKQRNTGNDYKNALSHVRINSIQSPD
jgi:hypothetical protein